MRAFPDKCEKWEISNSGATYPMWSRNGHELFFETLDNHIMVAAYKEKGDSFVAVKPRVWSEKQIGGGVPLQRFCRSVYKPNLQVYKPRNGNEQRLQ